MIDLLPALDKRMTRENLTGSGWLCLGSVEHEIRLLNISLTGLLAELEYNDQIQDYKDMLHALQSAPLIDLFLPELGMAGEANVVRVEIVKRGFRVGIEFRNLSYKIDELLYKRRVFRKNMFAPGHIVFNGSNYNFNTENVSVYGMVIRILGRLDFETGAVTRFSFNQLDLHGEAQVIWGDRDYNSTLLGLQFLHKIKAEMPAVEHFMHSRPLSSQNLI